MLYSIKVKPCPYPPQPVLYLRQGQSFLCAWYPDHGRLLSVLHPSTKGAHNIVESPALVNSDFADGQSPPYYSCLGGRRSRVGSACRSPLGTTSKGERTTHEGWRRPLAYWR